jgi:hypothetical protein
VNWTCDRCGHHENRRAPQPYPGPDGGALCAECYEDDVTRYGCELKRDPIGAELPEHLDGEGGVR